MTQEELETLLEVEVKNLTSYLDAADFTNAVDAAERDTWTLPQTSDFRIKWLIDRAKRHLFFYLASESAAKFKAKKFDLQQKFDHFFKLIEYMDLQFEKIQDERPDEFAGVSPFTMFGTKIDAGFQYDSIGRDTTYETDNTVKSNPSDAD